MQRREFLKKSGKIISTAVVVNALPASHSAWARQTKAPIAKTKTLLIASHPYPERSTFILALEKTARSVQNVEVRNLETIYGFDTRTIDGDTEREITRRFQRIVFLFPTHWFNITPMMKAYLNDTWGSVGPGLWSGKEMLIVSTAVGGASTYGNNGRIGVELKDVFLPMKASALHCGMTYLEPLVFQAINKNDIPRYQEALIERLVN